MGSAYNVVSILFTSCCYNSYRHALDGLWRVSKEEGMAVLWTGGSAVVSRAILMTIAQVKNSCDP